MADEKNKKLQNREDFFLILIYHLSIKTILRNKGKSIVRSVAKANGSNRFAITIPCRCIIKK